MFTSRKVRKYLILHSEHSVNAIGFYIDMDFFFHSDSLHINTRNRKKCRFLGGTLFEKSVLFLWKIKKKKKNYLPLSIRRFFFFFFGRFPGNVNYKAAEGHTILTYTQIRPESFFDYNGLSLKLKLN